MLLLGICLLVYIKLSKEHLAEQYIKKSLTLDIVIYWQVIPMFVFILIKWSKERVLEVVYPSLT